MLSFFKKPKKSLINLFSEDFIDIHSHLLPGIDDGAKNMKESVALIKRMCSYGIKNFVITPHIMDGVFPNTPTIINNKLSELLVYLKDIGINDVTIRAGAEYLLDSQFTELLKNKELLTIKDNYVLVEISYLNAPLNLYEIIFNIQIAGYKPILAHPERYLYYHNNYAEYAKLKDVGCLFQLNLLSLSNYYGKHIKKIAQKLLKEDMYNFVGTDTHHLTHLSHLEKINNVKTLKLLAPILKNNTLLK